MLRMYKLFHGDCLDYMETAEENSFDSIVTDPPYGMTIMGKNWDYGIPGEIFWENALRLIKPGGHMLAFGGSRTFHRLMCAIEDAGWEIRDTIMWVYGEGFPKSYDVGKGIDKLLKTGNASWNGTGDSTKGALGYSKLQYEQGDRPADYSDRHQTKTEITEEKALEWKGWGTALKPAFELIVVARKPFKGSIANNTLTHGTGALNIDACRVETKVPQKRWPANLIHDGSEEVEKAFPYKKSGSPNGEGQFYSRSSNTWGAVNINCGGSEEAYRYSDDGSASRFFYCAKASKKDRDEGLEDLELSVALGDGRPSGSSFERRGLPPVLVRNTHPTVKPTKLMRYLCRLVTRPDGVIFDPFMGSGSTGKASMLEGFSFVGCEQIEDYIKIARRRIEHAIKENEE
jgi:hypothetical protein